MREIRGRVIPGVVCIFEYHQSGSAYLWRIITNKRLNPSSDPYAGTFCPIDFEKARRKR